MEHRRQSKKDYDLQINVICACRPHNKHIQQDAAVPPF